LEPTFGSTYLFIWWLHRFIPYYYFWKANQNCTTKRGIAIQAKFNEPFRKRYKKKRIPSLRTMADQVPLIAPTALAHNQVAKNFSQLYQDAAKDPFRRQYERIMQRFDANWQGAILSVTLYQQVVNSGGSVLQAYLCCSRVGTGTRIFCLHLPTQFIRSLDGAPTPWDNKSFAFKGEAIQGLISVVQFPTNAFDEVEAYVRPLAYMLEHQDELDDAPCFPPAYDDDEDSEEVTTRNCMFLPAVYVPLLLRPSGYSAKEVWRLLYPAIEMRNDTEICTPLLQWLQVASTSTVGTTPALLGDPSNAITLTTPATDEVLMTHCHTILNRALPGLSAPPQTLETALSQMASALVAQTNDSRQARELKLATEQDPKLPSDRFTITLPLGK
jgi:hypothetical protein